MKVICQLLGQPGDHLPSTGRNIKHYFSRQQGSINAGWRLNSLDEYNKEMGVKTQISRCLNTARNLEDAVKSSREGGCC